MKLWRHIVIIVVVAMLFCGVSVLFASRVGDTPSWYDAPILFPLMVAIWVGGNPHNPSVLAGNLAWAFECVLVGLLADAAIAVIRKLSADRKFRQR